MVADLAAAREAQMRAKLQLQAEIADVSSAWQPRRALLGQGGIGRALHRHMRHCEGVQRAAGRCMCMRAGMPACCLAAHLTERTLLDVCLRQHFAPFAPRAGGARRV